MMKRILAGTLVLFLVSIVACSSNPDSRKKSGTSESTTAQSPLGLGYPDPEAMIEEALADAERGDFASWVTNFVYMDKDGKLFVGDSKDFSDDVVQGKEEMRQWASTYRTLANPAFVNASYSRPKNVRNTPPTIEVTVTRTFDFARVKEADRASLLERINATRPAGTRGLTWDEFVSQARSSPSSGPMRFVYLEKAWRFDATWQLTPQQPR